MGREINIGSIRALEKQIKVYENAIIKLKRARNLFLNISSLPPEVLGNIFCWNIPLEEPFDNMMEDWYNFLLVCHHWFRVGSCVSKPQQVSLKECATRNTVQQIHLHQSQGKILFCAFSNAFP